MFIFYLQIFASVFLFSQQSYLLYICFTITSYFCYYEINPWGRIVVPALAFAAAVVGPKAKRGRNSFSAELNGRPDVQTSTKDDDGTQRGIYFGSICPEMSTIATHLGRVYRLWKLTPRNSIGSLPCMTLSRKRLIYSKHAGEWGPRCRSDKGGFQKF